MPQEKVRELAQSEGIDLTFTDDDAAPGVRLIDPATSPLREKYAAEYARLRAHKGVELEQANAFNATQLQTMIRLYERIQTHVFRLMATDSVPKVCVLLSSCSGGVLTPSIVHQDPKVPCAEDQACGGGRWPPGGLPFDEF